MSAIVMLVVSLIASLSILARSAWFGRGDIPWFLGWSVPLGLATIPIARGIASRRWHLSAGLGGALVVGLTLGLAWSYFVIGALGVFIGGASIPFLLIWPFSAAAGIAAHVGSRSTRRGLVGASLLAIVLTACPLIAVESQPYVAGWQVLTVVKMKVVRPQATLDIVNRGYLTDDDAELLRESGVTGVVEVQGASTIGRRGPTARALVVSMGPLDRNLVVNQPLRVAAVYIQSRDRVDIFPRNTPLHRWRLRFDNEREGKFGRSINVVQEFRSSWSGGGLIHW